MENEGLPAALIERLRARSGPRFVEVMLGMGVLYIAAITPLNVAILALFVDASFADWARVVVAGELAELVAAGIWVPLAYRLMRPVIAWQRGERDPSLAPAAWSAAVAGLPRMVAVGATVVSLLAIPPAVYGAPLLDVETLGLVLVLAFLTITIYGHAVLIYLVFEQALRPVVREIAEHLPPGYAAQRRTIPLSTKLLVLLPTINIFTGILVAGLATNATDMETRLGTNIGVSLAAAMTFPLVAALLLRHSLLVRFGYLRDAFRRVQHGDLAANLPPLAGDELDEIGRGFNEMVGELRVRTEELVESRARVVAASDAERRRMERDLHDGAQQHLVLMQLQLGMLERQVKDDLGATKLVGELRANLDRALGELRDLAHGLYPSVLESDGLPAALRDAGARAAIPTRIDCDGASRYPRELEAAVYFCCLEALQNAAKHAGVSATATIALAERAGALRFEVADTGVGFNGAPEGHGLQNMRDRIGALGGELQVESAAGGGTRVAGTVPV